MNFVFHHSSDDLGFSIGYRFVGQSKVFVTQKQRKRCECARRNVKSYSRVTGNVSIARVLLEPNDCGTNNVQLSDRTNISCVTQADRVSRDERLPLDNAIAARL